MDMEALLEMEDGFVMLYYNAFSFSTLDRSAHTVRRRSEEGDGTIPLLIGRMRTVELRHRIRERAPDTRAHRHRSDRDGDEPVDAIAANVREVRRELV